MKIEIGGAVSCDYKKAKKSSRLLSSSSHYLQRLVSRLWTIVSDTNLSAHHASYIRVYVYVLTTVGGM